MTIQIYEGVPATLDIVQKLRLSHNIPAEILVQKRTGEARARELLQLPETSVRYLGFPVHVGTIGDKVYLLSLAENDGESIVITDVALAGQISRIFDKRFSLDTGYK